MVQELKIVTSCDVCADRFPGQPAVDAYEYVALVDGVPWVVDLCNGDAASIPVIEMSEAARKYGRPWAERTSPLDGLSIRGEGSGGSGGSGSEGSGGKRKRSGNVRGPRGEGGKHQCPLALVGECDSAQGFKTRGSLRGHFKTVHGLALAEWEKEQAGETPLYECRRGCGERFHTGQKRHVHEQEHDEPEDKD